MATFKEIKTQVLDNFRQNVRKVEELRKFDEILLEHIISLVKANRDNAAIPSAQSGLDKLLRSISNIKPNGSLKDKYRTINNQCVVLLVSYFASSIGEIFRKSFELALGKNKSSAFGNSELKLTVDEIKVLISTEENANLGDVFIKQKNINLHDMKSIFNVFKNCFDVEFDKDEMVNDIIVVQACRNSIVHSAELVDDHLINQARGAAPRFLKRELVLGSKISFEEAEIDLVIKSMNRFLEQLLTKMETFFELPRT